MIALNLDVLIHTTTTTKRGGREGGGGGGGGGVVEDIFDVLMLNGMKEVEFIVGFFCDINYT